MTKENSKVRQTKSYRLSAELITALDEYYEELGARDAEEFFQTILDQQYHPVKINEENVKKVQALQKIVTDSETATEIYNKKLSDMEAKHNAEKESLQSENDRLKTEISELINRHKLPEYSKVITFEPLNYLCLQYVVNKFTNQRKCKQEEWTPEMVINYFIVERLIKGTINGDIDSVPDSEIRKCKKQLENN